MRREARSVSGSTSVITSNFIENKTLVFCFFFSSLVSFAIVFFQFYYFHASSLHVVNLPVISSSLAPLCSISGVRYWWLLSICATAGVMAGHTRSAVSGDFLAEIFAVAFISCGGRRKMDFFHNCSSQGTSMKVAKPKRSFILSKNLLCKLSPLGRVLSRPLKYFFLPLCITSSLFLSK
jgi:hypothetical protein